MNKKTEKTKLLKLKPKKYRVYGIFNTKKEKLIYVNLDVEKVKLEFELEGYDDDYDIISFDVVIT